MMLNKTCPMCKVQVPVSGNPDEHGVMDMTAFTNHVASHYDLLDKGLSYE